MRFLVTGSRGMIGSHLMRRLSKEAVLGIDQVNADADDYLRADVNDFDELYRAFRQFGPDLVIHMAGEVGRLNGEQYPRRMLRTNVLGTYNVLKLCMDYSCRLINFSTSEVYGEAFDDSVVDESARLQAFGTTNVYAASKLFGEALVRHYVENYELKAVTVRPFMVYGEGEEIRKTRSAINNFVANALAGTPLTVHKDTLRAWCYVSDFLDGLSLLFDREVQGYQAFNIGSEQYTTALETAELVCEVAGASRGLIRLVDPPKVFSSPIKRASIARMKAMGYSPKVSLREGVGRVVEWQRSGMQRSRNPLP